MPVSSVGPLTMRGAVRAGLRDLRSVCTASKLGRVDDRRDRHLHHLGVWLALARLPERGVEPVAADVGRAREHLVHRANAPAAAVTGADTGGVEVLARGLDAHRSRSAVALARQAKDQPHGLGLDGIDLQGLLGAMAMLLGG